MAYNKQSDLSHINGGLPSTSSNNSKDEERLKKEIYGQLFRSEILGSIPMLSIIFKFVLKL
ncbi:hypothetical protein [Spiroplasma ixodetis]|uniref:Uncharacterized protein n=1 Tax=Spiroplasma ixodetis TaxID=2141 RepID=A0ABM8BVY6_9MOLU|nr:hypothetical protein [Spiroplasma ixodetis]BDT04033.1 hypothetical protein SHM_16790 [Spiroplasma ixodetis]